MSGRHMSIWVAICIYLKPFIWYRSGGALLSFVHNHCRVSICWTPVMCTPRSWVLGPPLCASYGGTKPKSKAKGSWLDRVGNNGIMKLFKSNLQVLIYNFFYRLNLFYVFNYIFHSSEMLFVVENDTWTATLRNLDAKVRFLINLLVREAGGTPRPYVQGKQRRLSPTAMKRWVRKHHVFVRAVMVIAVLSAAVAAL